jgi:hypothetical protein
MLVVPPRPAGGSKCVPSTDSKRSPRIQLPASPLPPALFPCDSAIRNLLAVPDGGRLQRVMDKLRLCMGPVKRQTQYIVLFFQMCCCAVKLLNIRVLPGNQGPDWGPCPGFPQGYVRAIEVQRRQSPASIVFCWAGLEAAALDCYFINKMFLTLRATIRRRNAAIWCRAVDLCGEGGNLHRDSFTQTTQRAHRNQPFGPSRPLRPFR